MPAYLEYAGALGFTGVIIARDQQTCGRERQARALLSKRRIGSNSRLNGSPSGRASRA